MVSPGPKHRAAAFALALTLSLSSLAGAQTLAGAPTVDLSAVRIDNFHAAAKLAHRDRRNVQSVLVADIAKKLGDTGVGTIALSPFADDVRINEVHGVA